MASDQAALAAAAADEDPPQIIEQPVKKSKTPKEVPPSREPGDKTTFPISRVQRIIKADKVSKLTMELFMASTCVYKLAAGDTNGCARGNIPNCSCRRGVPEEVL